MIKTAIKKLTETFKRIILAHEQKNLVNEIQLYPAHVERKNSSLYLENRNKLVHSDGQPCFFCEKTLQECENLGYTIETHHWFEYSLWDSLDPEKVLADLEKLDFYGYAKQNKGIPIESPDDIRNLVAICSPCHRESGYGIHHATIPFVWARRALKDKNKDVLKRTKPLNIKK